MSNLKGTLSLAAGLLALYGPGVNALGCYNGGLRFGDLIPSSNDESWITDDITIFCREAAFPEVGGITTSQNRCYGYWTGKGDNRLDVQLHWVGNLFGATSISSSDCIDWFKRERGGCETGSEQEYAQPGNDQGKWWIRIDPNEGTC